MQAIKQYTDVINGSIRIDLPKDFIAKRVELIILPADEEPPLSGSQNASDFEQFLLDSPEMSDDEYQAIEEKRQHFKKWK
jgi:hypothetical protein